MEDERVTWGGPPLPKGHMASLFRIILLCIVVLLQTMSQIEQVEASTKYRCAHCPNKGIYRDVYAYVTKSRDSRPDKIKLNTRFFIQSRCDEEGNYAHPLGNCRKYIRCHGSNSHPKIEDCRPGTTFDPFSRECEDELHARDCKSCNKPLGYKIPHEKGKKYFYMCQDGAAYEFECTDGNEFNRHTRSCGNAQPVVKPVDLDETYVPGSVSVHSRHGKTHRISTGLIYERRPDSEERRNYRRL